jgi:uncharacterized protein (DUF1800 family)
MITPAGLKKLCYSLAILTLLVALPQEAVSQTSSLTSRAAARFLDQATWGSTPASVAQLQQVGISAWLNAQFALNVSDLPDQPVLGPNGGSNTNLAPVQSAFFVNSLTQPDQLRQRVAFALSEIFVVSSATVTPAYAFPPYWRIFRDNAFGNYRDIIKAVTLNPAMGTYLTMANNYKASSLLGSAPNENYARELLQLFTLGLNQLNLDGSPVLTNGAPVPIINSSVVTNMAALLSGWTYPTAPGATPKTFNPPYYLGQMIPIEAEHDTTTKTIFGNVTIPSGQSAEMDLESLLTALMKQPAMPPFVCQQLIQHLVTSNPSPAYVQRVSMIFQNDGTGTVGNMKAVIAAILTDPEARAADQPGPASNPSFGHLREPILLLANLLRGLNATPGPQSAISSLTSYLGQNLFEPPSVFGYFSARYRLPNGLLAPEFQIYSTQTAANRTNLIYALLYLGVDPSTTINLAPFVQNAGSISNLVDYISTVFLHGEMSASLYQDAYSAASAAASGNSTLAQNIQARAALRVVLSSAEYQIIQ